MLAWGIRARSGSAAHRTPGKELGVIDGIITEPIGGAHRDASTTIDALGTAVALALSEFDDLSPERIRRFSRILADAGIVTTTRKTRGDDVDAACGQLAGQVLDKTRRTAEGRPMAPTAMVSSVLLPRSRSSRPVMS